MCYRVVQYKGMNTLEEKTVSVINPDEEFVVNVEESAPDYTVSCPIRHSPSYRKYENYTEFESVHYHSSDRL